MRASIAIGVTVLVCAAARPAASQTTARSLDIQPGARENGLGAAGVALVGDASDAEVEDVALVVGLPPEPGSGGAVPRRDLPPAGVVGRQAPQPDAERGRREVGQPRVGGHPRVHVVARDAVRTQETQDGCQLVVVGDDCTAVGDPAQVLRGIEAVGGSRGA